jgi:hypothetical protein
MQHLLSNVTADDVIEAPFPHVIVKDALDEELYQALSRQFPSSAMFGQDGKPLASNKSYRIAAHQSLADERVSSLWKEFIGCHVSQDFYNKVLSVFDKSVARLYPDLPAVLGADPKHMVARARSAGDVDIAGLDAQFVYTSPVVKPSTSCQPHTDRERCLYGGMLYMRLAEDDSQGGDLEFYRFKPGQERYRLRRHMGIEGLECVKTVPYDTNLFVIFLHSAKALHGVSPRTVTPHPRRYVNLICEYPKKIYDINDGVAPQVVDLPLRVLRGVNRLRKQR